VVAAVVLGLYLVVDRQFDLFGRRAPGPLPPEITVTAALPQVLEAKLEAKRKAAVAEAFATPPPAQASGLPLPSVYGVYAVSDGRLYELEVLPGRVPDQKVFMSTPIKTSSRVSLPDGRLAFVIYRRDIANNAPERVQVRVIARVMRAMAFNTAGQVNTAGVEEQWTIRGNSHDLRVAPVPESAEMLLLRPENADFALPAGRYGLVLKGQAYDFTVAGPITDPAQCLERVDATNGGFYSECRNP
jgi:hypothetical protein